MPFGGAPPPRCDTQMYVCKSKLVKVYLGSYIVFSRTDETVNRQRELVDDCVDSWHHFDDTS